MPGLLQTSVVRLLLSLHAEFEEQRMAQKEQEELHAPGLTQRGRVILLASSGQPTLLSQTTAPGQSAGQETQVSVPSQEPFPQQARVAPPVALQSGSMPKHPLLWQAPLQAIEHSEQLPAEQNWVAVQSCGVALQQTTVVSLL